MVCDILDPKTVRHPRAGGTIHTIHEDTAAETSGARLEERTTRTARREHRTLEERTETLWDREQARDETARTRQEILVRELWVTPVQCAICRTDIWRAGTTETVDLFLEQCLIPRMKMTLEDAMFSAKILFLLHQLQVPNYNLLDVCNKVCTSPIYIYIYIYQPNMVI